jgi:hypothetical protein
MPKIIAVLKLHFITTTLHVNFTVMARNNSIEESEYRELIEQKLLAGTPYRSLSNELAAMGIEISHTALHNYHRTYLGSRIERGGVAQTGDESEPISFDENLDNSNVLKLIYKRQLQIVASKQERFMNGECRMPNDEFRALKVITDIATTTKTDLQ